jgi:hypothetical protein
MGNIIAEYEAKCAYRRQISENKRYYEERYYEERHWGACFVLQPCPDGYTTSTSCRNNRWKKNIKSM